MFPFSCFHPFFCNKFVCELNCILSVVNITTCTEISNLVASVYLCTLQVSHTLLPHMKITLGAQAMQALHHRPLSTLISTKCKLKQNKIRKIMIFLNNNYFNYNLGQNKVKQLSPIPPKAMMKVRRSKNAPFWHHWIGGRGGPDVSFILSKIAILNRIKWNNYSPSPLKQWWWREGAKTRHFGIIELGGGVVQMFHSFCPRL